MAGQRGGDGTPCRGPLAAGVQAEIANAVYDAVGKRVRKLPIRIEDCL
jgi:CO/xanthine dehydrogenase Mo-binding subunit